MSYIKGLTEIKVGTAALDGTEPTTLTKIGKVYKESLEIIQDDPEISEFFEEGELFPEDSTEEGKPIGFKGELFADDTTLPLIGGSVNSGDWEINQSITTTKYVKFVTKSGKDFHAPNCKIIAKLIGKLTGKDIVRVAVIFKPQAVTAPAKAFRAEAKAIVPALPDAAPSILSAELIDAVPAAGATYNRTVSAPSTWTISTETEWLTVSIVSGKARIVVAANTGAARSGSYLLSLVADPTVTLEVTVNQIAAE